MLMVIIGIIIIILLAPSLIKWIPIVSILMLFCIMMGAQWAILPFIVSTAIWIGAVILKKKL